MSRWKGFKRIYDFIFFKLMLIIRVRKARFVRVFLFAGFTGVEKYIQCTKYFFIKDNDYIFYNFVLIMWGQ